MSILTIGIAAHNHLCLVLILLAMVAGCWSWLVRDGRNYWLVKLVTMSYLLVVPFVLGNMGLFTSSGAFVGMLLLALTPACWTTRQNLNFAMLLSWLAAGSLMAINVNPVTVALILLLSLLALPTMWLEYRSRLELPPLTWNWRIKQLKPIPWHYLARIAGIALGTGLMMALLLFLVPKPNLAQMAANLDYSWLAKLPKATSTQTVGKAEWVKSRIPSSGQAGQTAPNTTVPAQPGQSSLANPSSEQLAQAIPGTPVMGQSPQPSSTPVVGQSEQVVAGTPVSGQAVLDRPVIGQSGQTISGIPVMGQPPQASSSSPVVGESGQAVGVSDSRSMTEKYAQLSPTVKVQLQAKVQEIIQYQRQVTGKKDAGNVNEQLQDLSEFLQTHAQIGPTLSQPVESLLNNCPQPQSCHLQGSPAELKAAFDMMARSTIANPNGTKTALAPAAIDQTNPTTSQADSPQIRSPIDQVKGWQALGLLLVGALLIGGGFLWLRYEQEVRSYHRRVAQLPPLEQIYRQLLKQLCQQGLPAKRSPQSPTEYAVLVGNRLPMPSAQIVDRISQAYVAWRYGDKPANIDLMQRLLQQLITYQSNQKN